MTDLEIRNFVQRQRELLELELKSDLKDTADARTKTRSAFSGDAETSRSRTLQGLDVFNVSVGLYGRTVVMLCCRDDDSKLLPSHKFTVGDEVQIRSAKAGSKSESAPSGVVSQVTETSISIALFGKGKNSPDQEEDVAELDPPLSLLPKSSIEVHNKLVAALQELETKGLYHPVAGDVVSACFDQSSWTSNAARVTEQQRDCAAPSLQPLNENLDHTQVEAIEFALASKGKQPVALIHGPPGTGKTTTIAELIHQAASVYKQRLLVTAPSNVAVDNILERLVAIQEQQQASGSNKTQKQRRNTKRKDKQAQNRFKMVRLGHPARIKQSILPYSLESLVQASDGTEIVRDVRKELEHFLKVTQSTKASWNDKKAAYREIKSLRKEVRQREEKVVAELVQTAQVILCTTVGAANRILRDVEFDVVIIDEAAQALEASCWIPALKGKRLVLAGDHKQLPPTIQNTSIQKELGVTLFERIMDLYKGEENRVSRMLQVQYRMHQDIANWASHAMYQGRLQTFEGIKTQRLSQLPKVESDVDQPTLLLLDTAGCGMEESVNIAGSRYNEGEATLVQSHVQKLVDMGLLQKEIAIISPYNGQVEALKNLLLTDFPKLEIRSVDGFQGGEREAVILSLVRSNDSGGIGFLKDNRRLNVAITRAKRHVAVICDCDTVSKSRFIQGLVDWMAEHGEHRSAMEFEGVDEQDMVDAERELTKIMNEASLAAKESPTKSKRKPQPIAAQTKQSEAAKAEAKRKGLMDEISRFAEMARPDEELKLSSELTSYDRRLVHEFATQLGIDHRSEGLEGVDRRVTLTIPLSKKVAQPMPPHDTQAAPEDATTPAPEASNLPSSFAALAESDDEDTDADDDEVVDSKSSAENTSATTESTAPMNSLLGELAKERQMRAQAARTTPSKLRPAQGGGKKKAGKKKKGQKLGGTKKPVTKDSNDKSLDGLDDMAFLDTQIDKVQNSHGRKVEGKGSYKTIVNGILLSKPPPREKPKNGRASSALNAKLKAAQEERRGKKGKKKR